MPPTASASTRGWLARLTQLGVNPALPRNETKHIVLTNQWALAVTGCFGAALVGAVAVGLPLASQLVNAVGTLVAPVTWALNALGRPRLASAWLLSTNTAAILAAGALQPLAAEFVPFVALNAGLTWFVFPRTDAHLRVVISGATLVAGFGLLAGAGLAGTPSLPPGYDVRSSAAGNLVLLFVALAALGWRAATEIESVERALIEERRKTEMLLKREVAHQVAERSRELGTALARPGAMPAAALASRVDARYRIIRTLGEGGMGAVFEVERRTDGQRLALKLMRGETSREHAARFAREAEIGARVHDPHLVEIVDVGIANDGSPFLVMELVTGGSLESMRARFGDTSFALPILRDVAAGLRALHLAGVVHRDLKPSNVLVEPGGCAKVADFGIARVGVFGAVDASAPTAAGGGIGPGGLTVPGAWIGTTLYMAPEAARGGQEVGSPADVFAFGLLAYETLTGRLPFATPASLLALTGQALPPAPPLAVESLNAEKRATLEACLRAEAMQRPSIEEVRAALA